MDVTQGEAGPYPADGMRVTLPRAEWPRRSTLPGDLTDAALVVMERWERGLECSQSLRPAWGRTVVLWAGRALGEEPKGQDAVFPCGHLHGCACRTEVALGTRDALCEGSWAAEERGLG